MREVANGVWVEEDEMWLPGRIWFPIRATIVRLKDGSLWVHSPIQPKPEWVAALKELGEVKAIVAPNLFHHLHVESFHAAFPAAKVYIAPGLRDKKGWDDTYSDLNGDLWPEDFEIREVQGCEKLGEWVFLHGSSQSLIVTDVFFNFETVPSFLTRLLLRLFQAAPGLRISKFLNRYIADKGLFKASLEQAVEGEYKTLIMAHGSVLQGTKSEDLRKVIRARFP